MTNVKNLKAERYKGLSARIDELRDKVAQLALIPGQASVRSTLADELNAKEQERTRLDLELQTDFRAALRELTAALEEWLTKHGPSTWQPSVEELETMIANRTALSGPESVGGLIKQLEKARDWAAVYRDWETLRNQLAAWHRREASPAELRAEVASRLRELSKRAPRPPSALERLGVA